MILGRLLHFKGRVFLRHKPTAIGITLPNTNCGAVVGVRHRIDSPEKRVLLGLEPRKTQPPNPSISSAARSRLPRHCVARSEIAVLYVHRLRPGSQTSTVFDSGAHVALIAGEGVPRRIF